MWSGIGDMEEEWRGRYECGMGWEIWKRNGGEIWMWNGGGYIEADLPSLTEFRESPEMEHDLQVSQKCYKISRNLGNLIDRVFFCKKSMILV